MLFLFQPSKERNWRKKAKEQKRKRQKIKRKFIFLPVNPFSKDPQKKNSARKKRNGNSITRFNKSILFFFLNK